MARGIGVGPTRGSSSNRLVGLLMVLGSLLVVLGFSRPEPTRQVAFTASTRPGIHSPSSVGRSQPATPGTTSTTSTSTVPSTSTTDANGLGASQSRLATTVPARAGGGTAATPAPSPSAGAGPSAQDPVTASDTIGVANGRLVLDGSPYTFVGVNAYEIATLWGTNAGCGGEETDAQLDQLFASLPPNSLVRFWAFQGTLATNYTTHQLDWGPIDRVFAAAVAHHQRLVVTLTDQGGTCDNLHWQDPSWYLGGFQDVFNDPSTTDGRGLTPLSYWQYLQDIVQRYRTSPALGMWEPISEAEASTCPPQYEPTNCSGHQTCPNEAAAAGALRHFFDVVGAEIHTLDPDHLVENGFLAGGQCGTAGADYQYVSASPGIDVLSYHDYYGSSIIGGDQWNGIAVRLAQAQALNKPIIAGEMGIQAGTGSGCTTLQDRTSQIQQKIAAQLQAGASGALVWDWLPSPSSPCAYDTFPGDPLMQLIGGGTGAM